MTIDEDAFVVQTRYPHRSGRLVDWDADVRRAVVLVRSPMRALPALFDELWALAGKKLSDDVELRSLDPFYQIRFDDGDVFHYSGDPDKMRAEVRRISPGDAAGYERFMAEADHCYRLGFEALGAKAFDTVGDLLKASPAIFRMRGWRSLHAMVASHLKHPKLRMAMSLQSLLIGGNPFSVTCIYSLINALERLYGVHWAVGGTGQLIAGLVDLLEGQGGVLRCNAEVRRIEVTGGRASGVTLASGERIDADIVISNADTAWTYRHLVESEHRHHWTDRRIERGRYSMSLFVWYFGTRRTYPDVPHHMMLLGPRYRELLTDIFKNHHLAEDFSLYLHRPTASDPSMAPPGHDTFYVLAPVPHLDSGTDWSVRAAPYRDAVARVLENTHSLRRGNVANRLATYGVRGITRSPSTLSRMVRPFHCVFTSSQRKVNTSPGRAPVSSSVCRYAEITGF